MLTTAAYYGTLTSPKESEPITPDDLPALKQVLSEAQYNFIFVSVWFGLRPIEIERLYTKAPVQKPINAMGHRFEFEENYPTLIVFQWKLTGVQPDEGWKHIPNLRVRSDPSSAPNQQSDNGSKVL